MRWLRLLLVLTLTACATGPEPVSPEDPAARDTTRQAPTPAVIEAPPDPVAPSAVEALLAEARRLRAEGDLGGSFARVERALRIAPEDAEVYLELARTHAAAGQAERASAAAERGLLYCRGTNCSRLRDLLKT
ncbi:MAG: tetratricopeptide repeat protein [Pseudomonadota bacterium]